VHHVPEPHDHLQSSTHLHNPCNIPPCKSTYTKEMIMQFSCQSLGLNAIWIQ
jgi:hypothetical protein